MLKEVMEEEFRQSSKEGLVLADFYSTTCGPCKISKTHDRFAAKTGHCQND